MQRGKICLARMTKPLPSLPPIYTARCIAEQGVGPSTGWTTPAFAIPSRAGMGVRANEHELKMLSSSPIEKTARRRSKQYGAPIYSLRAQTQHDGVKNSLAIKLPAPRPIRAIVRNGCLTPKKSSSTNVLNATASRNAISRIGYSRMITELAVAML